MGAGIKMYEDNSSASILIYVEDDIQETKKIPSKLYDKKLVL